jgi:tRNA threonylcarbamoyladenosine biosynthesis protein TsaB
MKILALDTATDASSAALYKDGELFTDFQLAPREHTQLILKQLGNVLQQAEIDLQALDGIAFGRGPGAFTGLRIAAGVAQGIALSADKPVIPVSSLAAMALQTMQENETDEVCVALDARMEEIYWGHYKKQGEHADCNTHFNVELQDEELVIKPDMLSTTPASPDTAYGAGSGWDVYSDTLTTKTGIIPSHIISTLYPSASYIAQLAAQTPTSSWKDASQAQPIYLRNKVAQTIAERQNK